MSLDLVRASQKAFLQTCEPLRNLDPIVAAAVFDPPTLPNDAALAATLWGKWVGQLVLTLHRHIATLRPAAESARFLTLENTALREQFATLQGAPLTMQLALLTNQLTTAQAVAAHWRAESERWQNDLLEVRLTLAREREQWATERAALTRFAAQQQDDLRQLATSESKKRPVQKTASVHNDSP